MAAPIQPITARDAFAVSPSNTTVFVNTPSALYVASGGDVTVRTIRGSTVTFTDVPPGSILPITCDQVHSTGTDATGIVGLVY